MNQSAQGGDQNLSGPLTIEQAELLSLIPKVEGLDHLDPRLMSKREKRIAKGLFPHVLRVESLSDGTKVYRIR